MAVPTSATAVVSLAEAKRELRDPPDSADALITAHIAAAVNYIEAWLSRPILRVNRECDVLATGKNPMIFRLNDAYDVRSIKYWSDEDAFRLEPDESVVDREASPVVPLSEVGRVEYGKWPNFVHCIYQPGGDGWPDAYQDTFRVVMYAGIDIAKATGLKQAIILGVRQLWDGHAEVTMNNAMEWLANPWKRYVG